MVLGGLSIKVNNDKNEFHFVYQIKQKMTDNESNPTEMNNWVRIGNRQKTLLLNIGDLNSDDKQVVSRIEKFVRGISQPDGHILQLELPNELHLLKEILWSTAREAYKFGQKSPKPNLGECMNIMIKDKVSIQDTNPMLGYYYEAMVLEFLQRSMNAINADPEHINELDSKITENFFHFKNEIGQPVERDNFER